MEDHDYGHDYEHHYDLGDADDEAQIKPPPMQRHTHTP